MGYTVIGECPDIVYVVASWPAVAFDKALHAIFIAFSISLLFNLFAAAPENRKECVRKTHTHIKKLFVLPQIVCVCVCVYVCINVSWLLVRKTFHKWLHKYQFENNNCCKQILHIFGGNCLPCNTLSISLHRSLFLSLFVCLWPKSFPTQYNNGASLKFKCQYKNAIQK